MEVSGSHVLADLWNTTTTFKVWLMIRLAAYEYRLCNQRSHRKSSLWLSMLRCSANCSDEHRTGDNSAWVNRTQYHVAWSHKLISADTLCLAVSLGVIFWFRKSHRVLYSVSRDLVSRTRVFKCRGFRDGLHRLKFAPQVTSYSRTGVELFTSTI